MGTNDIIRELMRKVIDQLLTHSKKTFTRCFKFANVWIEQNEKLTVEKNVDDHAKVLSKQQVARFGV